MKFKASIDIMPLKALLDPQGKAVSATMKNIGLPEIENVRIGKHITFEITANTAVEAQTQAEEACRKLLANLIMEDYHVVIEEMGA